ncbi:unnamed protein product [Cuscuta epithymum]|uniref:ATP-binding cassette transporter n=1 Tax=Cuscuta epithymum TaxID=186058 RepID=A0AAV0E9I3_9ASTE|nr:unnamed protein product [Cuscuta epithymum]
MKGRKKTNSDSKIVGKTKSIFFFFNPFSLADGVDILLMSIGFLAAVGEGLSSQITLLITGMLLNNIGGGANASSTGGVIDSSLMSQNALYLCYMACAQWLLCFLEGYCWTRTAERQASRLRLEYMKAVLRQDVAYFDLLKTNTSDVITTLSSDSLIIQDVISEKVPVFVANISTFIGAYLVSFIMLWRLAVVALPSVLLLVIPGFMYGRTLAAIAKKMRVEYSKAGNIVEQALSSIRTVYSFVGESKTIENYSKALQGTVKLGLRQGLSKGLAVGSNGVVYAIWSYMSYYNSRLIMYHGVRGGTAFAVGAAITTGGLAFGSSLSNVKYFSEASAACERMMEVIKREPKIDSNNMDGHIMDHVSGEVEFKHVEFAYPSRPETVILKNFNLRIPAGKKMALVGGSGSGKSTTVALLQRFYDPLRGEVLLDGISLDKINLKWLRSQMGLVSQEPSLFATTIKENIIFGKEDASMEDVIEAAKAANAHNFISQLHQGYDTQVGEKGVQMSGGQKQRIAIARAIIRAPKIFLLDEATSALDLESERLVQEALDKVALGRTTIIIAHRLSTIRNVDLISVVQNGQVKEIGSHSNLIENENSIYSSLVRQQIPISQDISSDHHIITTNKELVVGPPLSITSMDLQRGCAKFEDKGLPQAPSFRRLLALNLPEWKQATLGSIGAMLFGAVQPTYGFVLGAMLSVFFLPTHAEIKEKITIYSLCFLGLSVLAILLSIVQHYNFAIMGEYLTKRMRVKILSKILTFEIGWYDKDNNSTGAICSRLATDANVVRSLVGDRMALLIQTCSSVIVSCTLSLVIAWRLALLMMAAQPAIIMGFYYRRVFLKNMSQKAAQAQGESSKIAVEAVTNVRTVTSFSSQAKILQMLKKSHEGTVRDGVRQSWCAGIVLAISTSLITLNVALAWWYGGKLVENGLIPAKSLFQTFFILITTSRVIAEAATMTSDLAKGSNAVRSIFAVLDRETRIDPEDPNSYIPEKVVGNVEIRDVHFTYPERPDTFIFKGFSMVIQAGKATALVGPSGSGKSTIIALIQRFYDPVKGSVRIDGRDLRSYNLRSLRKHIALVSQEPALFAGTVRQNITYGVSETANEAEIVAAAKAANAHAFIDALEHGYDTWCGDRGVQLSGGQKQRVAIARAVLKNASVLLLDEATSALDSESERLVQEALDRIMIGRTSVVVAHRLSTIRNCDVIAVLDKGELVEEGTHSSLLAEGPSGVYYSLLSLQNPV